MLMGFKFTGCDDCQTIVIELKNNALEADVSKQGIYQRSSCVNGRNSWVSPSNAVWYVPHYQEWYIGYLENIGTYLNGMQSFGQQGDLNCPYNVSIGNWQYFSGGAWIMPEDVNDISIGCFQGYLLLAVILLNCPQNV